MLREIGDSLTTAYTDLVGIFRQMWPVLLGLCALFLITAMAWFALPLLVNTGTGRMVMRYLVLVGCACAASPYYIALHRFVALGEVRWVPTHQSYGHASAVYSAWAAFSLLLAAGPLLIAQALARLQTGVLGASLSVVLIIGSWIVLVRLTTILPLAALDPREATWRRAFEQSRGRGRFIFAATTAAASPAYLALLLLGRAAADRRIEELPFFVLALASMLALQVLPLSIGTRLYWQLRSGAADSRITPQRLPRS